MDLKKTGLVILAFVLGLSAASNAQLIMNAEFITLDNVGNMAADAYTPKNDYTYHFVNGASDISNGSDFAMVRNAFGIWADEPTSDLSVTEITRNASFTPGTRNGYNDISWIASGYGYDDPWGSLLGYSSRAIAVVVTWYSSWSGAVSERDMYFNDVNFDWRTDSDGVETGGFHVGHIALHEAGHIFGLKDVYNPGQPGWQAWMGSGNENLTMYGYSSWYNDDMTLSEYDIAAISELFPSAVTVPEPKAAVMFMMTGGILFVVRKP
ncbi:MAG: hypothetical protein ACYSUT_07070 [Planctomycetota bacterium]|jgi:hypothetical protein